MSDNRKIVLLVLLGVAAGNLFFGSWLIAFLCLAAVAYVGRAKVKELLDRNES